MNTGNIRNILSSFGIKTEKTDKAQQQETQAPNADISGVIFNPTNPINIVNSAIATLESSSATDAQKDLAKQNIAVLTMKEVALVRAKGDNNNKESLTKLKAMSKELEMSISEMTEIYSQQMKIEAATIAKGLNFPKKKAMAIVYALQDYFVKPIAANLKAITEVVSQNPDFPMLAIVAGLDEGLAGTVESQARAQNPNLVLVEYKPKSNLGSKSSTQALAIANDSAKRTEKASAAEQARIKAASAARIAQMNKEIVAMKREIAQVRSNREAYIKRNAKSLAEKFRGLGVDITDQEMESRLRGNSVSSL